MSKSQRFRVVSMAVLGAAVAARPASATWNMTFIGEGRPRRIIGPQLFAERNQEGSFTLPPKDLARRRRVSGDNLVQNVFAPDSTASISLPMADGFGNAPQTRRSLTYHDLNIVKGQRRDFPLFHNTLQNRGVVFVFDVF